MADLGAIATIQLTHSLAVFAMVTSAHRTLLEMRPG